MGLKERIEAIDPYQHQDRHAAIDEAAQLAQEADALMQEMAGELRDFLEWVKMGDYDQSFVHGAEKALNRYNQYKEQTNEQ